MPFASKAQMRFMYAKHPAIAKRWQQEFHQTGKNLPMYVKATPTNESNHPAVTRMPRLPGNQRDFGMLKPSASSRFVPRNKPYPNQQESDKEAPVQGQGDSYDTGHRMFKHEVKHPPNHTTNVKRAHKRIGF